MSKILISKHATVFVKNTKKSYLKNLCFLAYISLILPNTEIEIYTNDSTIYDTGKVKSKLIIF